MTTLRARVVYKGVSTKRLYQWGLGSGPAGSVDAAGIPVSSFSYNGETVVYVGESGEIARGVKGGPPSTDIYGFTTVPSTWESASG